MSEGKIALKHPEGKNAPRISRETYLLFEKAITDTLENQQPATFTEIVAGIRHCFFAQDVKFDGSVAWYAVSVKLHMEATGNIQTHTAKGRKMHSLSKDSKTKTK